MYFLSFCLTFDFHNVYFESMKKKIVANWAAIRNLLFEAVFRIFIQLIFTRTFYPNDLIC